MGKLRQGSSEKKGLENELITKQRDSKGVRSSSTVKAKVPTLVYHNVQWNSYQIDQILEPV